MISDLRQGIRQLPSTLRRPDLMGRWLTGAHRAQFVLVLAGALALFSLPPLLGWALPRLYPPVRTSYTVLGIPALSRRRPDPRVAERREQITVLVWAVWLGAVAVMMLAELPRAVAGARRREEEPNAATLVTTPGIEPPQAATRIESSVGRMGAGNRYKLTRELGRGGMGIVYHAIDTVLQREVALKELPLQLGARTELAQRFRQEARVLARLSHPCIVQVHDLIEDDGRLWIALEFVRGGTLGDAMRMRGGALPWTEVVRIGRNIAEGLSFAHEQGVIHRDIKPMNVLLTDADPPLAKLTDFGLARLVESTEHTQPGSLLGSANYMSPEQVSGRPADVRSDLYSLGITFFEMLTGRVPFEGEFAAVLARQIGEAPPDLRERAPEAPPELASLVMSMLAKAPEDRPAGAGFIARALDTIAERAAFDRAA
ncbi:MAG: serine/threonine-protein kinase [Candidatus Eisenbacteria bacterium]